MSDVAAVVEESVGVVKSAKPAGVSWRMSIFILLLCVEFLGGRRRKRGEEKREMRWMGMDEDERDRKHATTRKGK